MFYRADCEKVTNLLVNENVPCVPVWSGVLSAFVYWLQENCFLAAIILQF